jgi:PII-like signaling protein
MSLRGEQVLLRAYLQSADRAPHTPTFERLVRAARKEHLAGATVLRGIYGLGSHGVIKQSAWSIVGHVPIIVEIVDSGERILSFVEGPLEQIMVHGMVTLERANVMLYRDRKHDEPRTLALGSLLEPLSTLPRIAERARIAEGGRMKVNEHGILLRIFVGESDRFANKRLYEAIVGKARELGLAGATVLRGTEGFGAHSVVHSTSLLEMSTDLPIVIEIVDTEEQIKRLLPHLEEMVQEGMITMEYVMIILYRDEPPKSTPES